MPVAAIGNYGSSSEETEWDRYSRILQQLIGGVRDFESVRRGFGGYTRSTSGALFNDRQILASGNVKAITERLNQIFSNRNMSIPTAPATQPGAPGSDRPGPAQGTAPGAGQNMAARQAMQAVLAAYGLTSQSLVQWIDDLVKQGYTTLPILQLYEREEFKTRFPAFHARAANGLSPVSVEEIIQFERLGAELVRRWGLPEMFASNDYLQERLAQGWSLSELNDRVAEGWVKVAQADVSVRTYFDAEFGDAGEVALASFFLDPDRTLPELERVAIAAQVGGAAGRFSIGLGRDKAMRLADLGVTGDQASQGFRQLNQMRGLFNETVEESTDLALENQGVDLAFGVDGIGEAEAADRLEERRSRFGGGGGALGGGLGSAR